MRNSWGMHRSKELFTGRIKECHTAKSVRRKTLRCKMATEHSYKLRIPPQLSVDAFHLDSPSLLRTETSRQKKATHYGSFRRQERRQRSTVGVQQSNYLTTGFDRRLYSHDSIYLQHTTQSPTTTSTSFPPFCSLVASSSEQVPRHDWNPKAGRNTHGND